MSHGGQPATLESIIRSIVRDELTRTIRVEPSVYYTTAPGGRLPPRRSRRWLREHAHEMGGTRTGGARGRSVVWTVTREQYERWLASRTTRIEEDVHLDPKPAATPSNVIDGWITASGYRLTGAG